MAGEYDASDFVDTDFVAHKSAHSAPGAGAPTRQEVDRKVVEAQQKLAELKHAQEELERQRGELEDLRRRQTEFQTGRQEMIQQLTRGLGLLEEAEFNARREAEQMAKTTTDFKSALAKVQAIREENWTKDNFNIELTRALTAVENARLEWNGARQKLPILQGENRATAGPVAGPAGEPASLANLKPGRLCLLGLALTWPLLLTSLAALATFVLVLLKRH